MTNIRKSGQKLCIFRKKMYICKRYKYLSISMNKIRTLILAGTAALLGAV